MDNLEKILISILEEDLNQRGVKIVLSPSGGILNRCGIYETNEGKFFVKANTAERLPMFDAEAKGLRVLQQTGLIRVPLPIYTGAKEGSSFIIMECIPLFAHTPSSQRELGSSLARIHLLEGPKLFGFEVDNTIGTTPQPNPLLDNWVEFFVTYRLKHLFRLLEKATGDNELMIRGEKFMEKFPEFFNGTDVVPSLLHGDLWSGNTGADENGRPVVFDPAVYYGHHEADFGILLMFGGFSADFHAAYRELIPKEPGFEERQLGYQLYHYLNHYLLFGSSYRPSCMALMSRAL